MFRIKFLNKTLVFIKLSDTVIVELFDDSLQSGSDCVLKFI